MAGIVLSSAGSALGGSVAGTVGSFVGQTLGQIAGNAIDDKIFGPTRLPDVHGARLADLAVQTSSYGKMIPIVYGNIRIGGNVIWSQPRD